MLFSIEFFIKLDSILSQNSQILQSQEFGKKIDQISGKNVGQNRVSKTPPFGFLKTPTFIGSLSSLSNYEIRGRAL